VNFFLLVPQLALWLLGVPAIVACVYLGVLILCSAPLRRPQPSSRTLRFEMIVPAHNEAAVVGLTLASLKAVNWPQDAYRIVVVADNCDDDTAEIARKAGVQVLERNEPAQRGKGYALGLAFRASLENNWADAVVVVDADTVVTENILEAFAARIERGAGAMQAHYGVLNPHASWRTQLITIAHGAFHVLRSRARERLRLSCGLRGNGWCVTLEALRRVPYAAWSLTEDLEYGIDLGLAGERVHYAFEAAADAEMSTSAQVAAGQRQRWEQGRSALVRGRTLTLLAAALQRRSGVCLDLALDLLLPPLANVVLLVLMFNAMALAQSISQVLVLSWTGGISQGLSLSWMGAAALVCAGVLLVYVLRGWALSGVGRRGARALACAPLFMLWKLSNRRRNALQEWAPTRRETR
jgi:hypothetical protein